MTIKNRLPLILPLLIAASGGQAQIVTAAATHPHAVAVNPVTNQIYVANSTGSTVTVIDGATNSTSSVTVGAAPQAVAVNLLTNRIYVANAAGNSVTEIDGVTGNTATIPVGTGPLALAVNPATNQIYVANSSSGTVTVIDGATGNTSSVNVGLNPIAVAIDPVANRIYVANQGSGNVTAIDGATQVTTTVPTGANPTFLAVNPVTVQVYVVNLRASGPSTVTVIDGATNGTTLVNVGRTPSWIVADVVLNRIYVSNFGDGTVTAIDGATNATSTVAVKTGPGTMALNPVTGTLYVANRSDSKVRVIGDTTATLPAGTSPGGMAVNPITNRIYVANGGSNHVTVIDGATNRLVTVDPVATQIYVGNRDDDRVTEIDGATVATSGAKAGGMAHDLRANTSADQAGTVNPATDKTYSADASGITIPDGTRGTRFEMPANGLIPSGPMAANPAAGTVYAVTRNTNTFTVLTGQSVEPLPLTVSVAPLSGNSTDNRTPTFNFIAASGFSPNAPPPLGVYYQLDTWQGMWTAAAGPAPSFSATTAALQPGPHTLYVFAYDGQLTSSITAYGFTESGTTSAPAKLAFLTQPPTQLTAGAPFGVVVEVQDGNGNLVTSTANVTIGSTTVSATNGFANFNNLAFTTAGNYTLTATSPGLASASSNPITVVAAAASQLMFTTQPPANVTPGAPFGAVVQVQDANGNLAISTANVTIGSTTVSAANGIATFSNLSFNTPGNYTLTATSPGLASATSNSITVLGPAKLAFTTQPPANTTAGAPFGAVVQVQDANGNLAISTAIVTIGSTTVSAVNGIAMFSSLSFTTAGNYMLTATSPGLASATSSSFTISAAAPNKLAFTIQPPANVTAGTPFSAVVQVQDLYGNAVNGTTATVTVGSSPVSAVGGIATFNGLTFSTAGNYTLTAMSPGLASTMSNSIQVSAAAAVFLTLVLGNNQSTPVNTAFPNPLVVKVTDQFQNAVGGATVSFTPVPQGGASASLRNGGTAMTDNMGQASITATANGTAGSYFVNAVSGAASGSFSLTNTNPVAPVVTSFQVLFGSQSYNLTGSSRNRIPWQVTGIRVVFSEPATSATVNSLSGISAVSFTGLGTNTLTWSTANILADGAYAVQLAGTGAAAIKDAAGNPLGAGAGFSGTVKILVGDYNDDGAVSASDLALVNLARGKAYNLFADLNGDGVVDLNDVQIVRISIGTVLP